jgi:hypothetical protein
MDSGSHKRLLTSSPLCFCISLFVFRSIVFAAAPTEHMLVDGTGLSGLTPETPFGDAIDMLRYSVDPPLKIVVNWRDLEDNLGIDRDTPVMMDPISGVKLSTALSLLLWAVSGGTGELDYTVQNGVVLVATTANIQPVYSTQVYDISTLLAQPANYQMSPLMGMMIGQFFSGGYGGGYGYGNRGYGQGYGNYNTGAYGWPSNAYGPNPYGPGASTQDLANHLISIIKKTVAPDTWDSNSSDAPSITYNSGKLLVRHEPQNLELTDEMVATIRRIFTHTILLDVGVFEVEPHFLTEACHDIDFHPAHRDKSIRFTPEDANLPDYPNFPDWSAMILDKPKTAFVVNKLAASKKTTPLIDSKVVVFSGVQMPLTWPENTPQDSNSPEPTSLPCFNVDVESTLAANKDAVHLKVAMRHRENPRRAYEPPVVTIAAAVPRGSSLILTGFPKTQTQPPRSHILLITPQARTHTR